MAVVRKLRLLGAELHGAIRTGGASPAWAAKRGLQGQTPGPNRARPGGDAGTCAGDPAAWKRDMAVETSASQRPRARHSADQPRRRITTNVSAGCSTSPKLEKQTLQRGHPVAAAIRTPRFIAPHRRTARAERYGQTPSSQRGRHLSATPSTPVYAPGRAKRQRLSVTDPIEGTAASSGRGHAATTRL